MCTEQLLEGEGITYLTDKYMVENGYFTVSVDKSTSRQYEIYTPTEKYRKLSDTCMRIADEHKCIVTYGIMIEAMKGETKRNKPKNYYVKKERPAGYLTVKQRNELKKKRK